MLECYNGRLQDFHYNARQCPYNLQDDLAKECFFFFFYYFNVVKVMLFSKLFQLFTDFLHTLGSQRIDDDEDSRDYCNTSRNPTHQ